MLSRDFGPPQVKMFEVFLVITEAESFKRGLLWDQIWASGARVHDSTLAGPGRGSAPQSLSPDRRTLFSGTGSVSAQALMNLFRMFACISPRSTAIWNQIYSNQVLQRSINALRACVEPLTTGPEGLGPLGGRVPALPGD